VLLTHTRGIRWPALATAMLVLGGCGGPKSTSATQPKRTAATTPGHTAGPKLGELLSVPAVGRIFERCIPGESRWKLKFINDTPVTDGVTYRVDRTRPRRLNVEPGQALAWNLVPGRYTSYEPADPVTHFPAATIKTTAPVSLEIDQGSEPHVYVVEIRFAVAAAIGDTADCALISSSMNATTYYPGGQPPG